MRSYIFAAENQINFDKGCTHGIGLAYAHELAKRKMNLILISRNSALLRKEAAFFGNFLVVSPYLKY